MELRWMGEQASGSFEMCLRGPESHLTLERQVWVVSPETGGNAMRFKVWVLFVAMMISTPVWADDCLKVAHEQREERCGDGDEACHDRVDRELKRCLAREGREREGGREANKPAPYVYIPGQPSSPTIMPGWR